MIETFEGLATIGGTEFRQQVADAVENCRPMVLDVVFAHGVERSVSCRVVTVSFHDPDKAITDVERHMLSAGDRLRPGWIAVTGRGQGGASVIVRLDDPVAGKVTVWELVKVD